MTAAVVTPAYLRENPLPDPGDSKRSRGTALVIGGSEKTPGAVTLAGLAALRVGAGVLSLAVPAAVAIPLAVANPEAGVTAWSTSPSGPFDPELVRSAIGKASSVVVGPGLDDPELARDLVACALDAVGDETTLVLDAFALGALDGLHRELAAVDGRCVLTPNRSEAARLLDTDAGELESLPDADVAAQLTDQWPAVVIYQGIVAAPGRPQYTVATGHGGLGTSGSGDVLAGAVAGILARGTDTHLAACWATYLHAAAGDRLASRIGRLGFLARELLVELPLIMSELNT